MVMRAVKVRCVWQVPGQRLIHPREPVVNHTAKRVEPLAHLATKCAKAFVHRVEPLVHLVTKYVKASVDRAWSRWHYLVTKCEA